MLKQAKVSVRLTRNLKEITAKKAKEESISFSKKIRDILNIYYNGERILSLEKIYNEKKDDILEFKEFLKKIKEASDKIVWLLNNIANSVNQIAHDYNIKGKLKTSEEIKLAEKIEELQNKDSSISKNLNILNSNLNEKISSFVNKILIK